MDESSIAAKVAQNIPQEPLQAPTQTTADEPQNSAFDSNIELSTNEHMILADYFELSRIDTWSDDKQRQIREVYRWAAEQAQSKELGTVMNVLRNLEMELGIMMKPNKLLRIAKFVELKRKSDLINAQMGAVMHGE